MLLFRSGRFASQSWLVCLMPFLLSIAVSASDVFAQSKGHKKKQARATMTSSASPGEQSLTNIPLPIGHEAKGLVLPDFDGEGHLRARFEAGTAHRIDRDMSAFSISKSRPTRRKVSPICG